MIFYADQQVCRYCDTHVGKRMQARSASCYSSLLFYAHALLHSKAHTYKHLCLANEMINARIHIQPFAYDGIRNDTSITK